MTDPKGAIAYTYDGYDRPLKAGDGTDYVYDGFGRQTLIPATDAPEASLGDIGVTYFDDDLAHSITQDGVTTTFELDPAGRRLTQTTTDGTSTSSLLRHYGDDSDNPAWATNHDGYLMRFTPSLDGLGAIVDADGNVNMPLANPHGDNVTTVIIPQAQAASVAVTRIGGWADYTEYGVSKTGQTRGCGYGWLGSHERATMPETAGLTLMGSRLYNPVRGAFDSVDPVAGGNITAYTYPQDPINNFDLDGQSKKSKRIFKKIGKWAGYAGLVACTIGTAGACMAAAGVVLAANVAANRKTIFGKKVKGSTRAKAIGSAAFDAAGVVAKPLRLRGIRGGVRATNPAVRKKAHKKVSKSLRYSIKNTPKKILAMKIGWNVASGYKTYKGW